MLRLLLLFVFVFCVNPTLSAASDAVTSAKSPVVTPVPKLCNIRVWWQRPLNRWDGRPIQPEEIIWYHVYYGVGRIRTSRQIFANPYPGVHITTTDFSLAKPPPGSSYCFQVTAEDYTGYVGVITPVFCGGCSQTLGFSKTQDETR